MNENRSFLKQIEISGYKSIGSDKKAQSLELTDATIIIGANGSGKSNFISFFKMLNNMMTGAFQVYVAKNGTAEEFLYFGSKTTPVLSAKLTFENQNKKDVYSFSLAKSIQDSLIFTEENIEWNYRKYPLDGGQKESFLSNINLQHYSEKIVRLILSNCRAFQFHDTSDTSYIRGTSRIDNNHFLMSNGGNLAALLYMIKNKSEEYKKYYNRIVDVVRCVVPQFDDFVLEPQQLNPEYIKLNWKEKDFPEYLFGPEQLSDGSIRFIALATLFLQPLDLLPNVIIIDEPELGLHPQAIDVLATLIKNASKKVQVIVATQSARLLDSFSANEIVVAEHDALNKCSTFKRLDEEKLEKWLDDYSLSELWDMNVLGGQP